jgi:hypothetical protein
MRGSRKSGAGPDSWSEWPGHFHELNLPRPAAKLRGAERLRTAALSALRNTRSVYWTELVFGRVGAALVKPSGLDCRCV